MRYNAALIIVIIAQGCNYSNTPSTQTSELKKDTLENTTISDSIQNLQKMFANISNTQKLFIGKHRVTYEDGSFKNIVIDSNGNISGSKNYKILRILHHNPTKSMYLVKGNNETHSPKDTFSYLQEGKQYKCYLINNHQNTYKFTLTKISK
ncbi:MAG: hypothetical protein SGJ10_05330 [Bacteroidota bacterium]|nr:hypothetical protein [Bacteroidota bacterium]